MRHSEIFTFDMLNEAQIEKSLNANISNVWMNFNVWDGFGPGCHINDGRLWPHSHTVHRFP